MSALDSFDSYIGRVQLGDIKIDDEAVAECFADLARAQADIIGKRLDRLFSVLPNETKRLLEGRYPMDVDTAKIEMDLAAAFLTGRTAADGAENPHFEGRLTSGKGFVPNRMKALNKAWADGAASRGLPGGHVNVGAYP